MILNFFASFSKIDANDPNALSNDERVNTKHSTWSLATQSALVNSLVNKDFSPKKQPCANYNKEKEIKKRKTVNNI